jgi:non-structural maintenance of chromosomes element 1
MEWEPPLPPGYNDTHRAFVQAFMARGTLTFAEGQLLLAAIATASANGDNAAADPESVSMADFENYIRIARDAVAPLDFDIRNTRHQVRRGERVWAFINSHSDPVTQMSTIRSADEMAYIKRLLDAMFDEYNTPRLEVMAVEEGQALKVSRPPHRRESGIQGDDDGQGAAAVAKDKGLKHSEVLALLSSLVAEGWLEKSRGGFYSLSPRSLMELWSWLVATYNDANEGDGDGPEWQRIKFCEACKEIVTHGKRCAQRNCMMRLHDICEAAYWRTRRDKKCPQCNAEWDGEHFVGERAVTSSAGLAGRRSRGGGGSSRRRSDLSNAVAGQQEAADAEDDEMEA